MKWLGDYLQVYRKELAANVAGRRYTIQAEVRLLYHHADLAGVQPARLGDLPENEGKEWRAFLAAVTPSSRTPMPATMDRAAGPGDAARKDGKQVFFRVNDARGQIFRLAVDGGPTRP